MFFFVADILSSDVASMFFLFLFFWFSKDGFFCYASFAFLIILCYSFSEKLFPPYVCGMNSTRMFQQMHLNTEFIN